MGDSVGGLALANGILAALLRRERTGVGSVVDTSLLGAALWQLFPDVLNAPFNADAYRDGAVPNHPPRDEFPNPLTNYYKTKDGRYLFLVMMDSNRYWPILCERLDRPDLVDDARFSNAALRTEHRVACIRELDDVFATRTLSEWTARFDGMDAPWAPVQNALEVHDDQQVVANGYLPEVEDVSGRHVRLVAAPAQFDETPAVLERAPLLGEHTEEVLLEAGVTWDELIEHKLANVLL
jgi:crotonobetainyl-CoA:carnitine CoA-transferase CaiB-like acyl-CoA transferase